MAGPAPVRRSPLEWTVRILVITNYYPPHHFGGYELGCRGVVDGLSARGHDVRVLCSRYGTEASAEPRVTRTLPKDFTAPREGTLRRVCKGAAREMAGRREFRRALRQFRPDVVYSWNLWHLPLAVWRQAWLPEVTATAYVFDEWPLHLSDHPWNLSLLYGSEARAKRIVKAAIRPAARLAGVPPLPALAWRGLQFASDYLRRRSEGRYGTCPDSVVIPFGIDPARFPFRQRPQAPTRLLCTSRPVPDKGLHTLIESLALLRARAPDTAYTLTLVSGHGAPDCEARLRARCTELHLGNKVTFVPFGDRDGLAALYDAHDLFLFPSVWEEPFGIVLLEAMACGLPVVATGTGGSGEIARHEQTALLFPREDAEACAEAVLRLTREPVLRHRLALRARAVVEAEYALDRTITAIAGHLNEIADGRPARRL